MSEWLFRTICSVLVVVLVSIECHTMAKRGFDEMLIGESVHLRVSSFGLLCVDDNSMDVESTTDEDRESVDDQNDHIETSCGLCGGPRRKKFRPKLMSWSKWGNSSVFVSNLSPEIVHETLLELFSHCGTIIEVHIPIIAETGRPRGFAYVQFVDIGSVARAIAMSGYVLYGRPIYVLSNKDPTFIPGSDWARY